MNALAGAVSFIITELGEGNPGALNVLCAGYSEFGATFVERILSAGLKGPAIWAKFKDEHGEDLADMFSSMEVSRETP